MAEDAEVRHGTRENMAVVATNPQTQREERVMSVNPGVFLSWRYAKAEILCKCVHGFPLLSCERLCPH